MAKPSGVIPAMVELGSRLAGATDLRTVRSALMDHLGSVVPSRAHAIYELLPSGRPDSIDTSAGVPAWFLDAYEGDGRPTDPVYAAIRRSHGTADSASLLHWRRWRREPVYQVLDAVGFHRSLQASIVVRGQLRATLNLARSNGDPRYRPVDIARLEQVRSLVSDVYSRVLDNDDLLRKGDLSAIALDAIAEPVVVSTPFGETLLLNRAARKATNRDGGSLASLCLGTIRENLGELRASNLESVRRSLELPGLGPITVRTAWLVGQESSVAISYLYRRRASESAPPLDHSPLSSRERELVALIGQGLTVHEIAGVAMISANTVKQHLKRIYAKLGVHTRAELVQVLWQSSMPETRY